MPPNYHFDSQLHANRAIHPQSLKMAATFSFEDIVRCHRENYLRLAEMIGGIQGIELLFQGLPDGVCPLSLPLLSSNRDMCVEMLQSMGVGAYPWWSGFYRNAIGWDQFPDACWLKNRLFTLPVHQGLNDRHLEYIASSTAKVLQITR
jgi:dTDP-4-amino-4,6-dideoxygalactose transaminase